MNVNDKAIIEIRSRYRELLEKAAKIGLGNLLIDKDINAVSCESGTGCCVGGARKPDEQIIVNPIKR